MIFPRDSPRIGTHVDREALTTTLKTLGFEVRVFNDFSLKEIDQTLEKCASEDHSEADCIAVFVLTHGNMLHSLFSTLIV